MDAMIWCLVAQQSITLIRRQMLYYELQMVGDETSIMSPFPFLKNGIHTITD